MRGLALRLDAMRCPDDVELIHRDNYPDFKWVRYGAAGPDWFAHRSERQERTIIRHRVDLEDPLVVRFVNATDDDKLVKFLSRFGLPDPLLSAVKIGIAEPRNVILGRQKVLRRLLEDAGSGDPARARKAANESLRFGGAQISSLEPDGRMVSTARCLMDFMYMEIAIAAANGARLGSCKRCCDVFLYGRATKRRSTSTYCSNKCRVGGYRAKKRNHNGG
jgi:hypothetical protein